MSEERCTYCGNGDRWEIEYAIKDFKPTDEVVCMDVHACRKRMNGIINLINSELNTRIRQHTDDYKDYEETCKELEQARAEVERLQKRVAELESRPRGHYWGCLAGSYAGASCDCDEIKKRKEVGR